MMKLKKSLYFVWIILLLVISCKNPGSGKSQPPPRVEMVLRTAGADTLDGEPGIDAAENIGAAVNGIQLMWYNPVKTAELDHYNIYRSEDPAGLINFNVIAEKKLNQAGSIDSLFIDTQDLQKNVRYYYFVTVVNKDKLESDPSDTLSYQLLERAANLSLNGNSTVVSQPQMEFEWWMNSGQTPDQYILRVEAFVSEDFHPVVYLKIIKSTYQSPQSYLLSGDWLKQVFADGKYRWRIDCVGAENTEEQFFSGSESEWAVFTVKWSN